MKIITVKSPVNEAQESIGWMALAEKSMSKIWNNQKDNEVWKQYHFT